ncbi:helix-turn-helix domain-containing protein [Propionimicrobium sp. PCR01-08-3]|nr:helix-turn-helix domain-containing protein [Propionimicrobium sp. PCR01-08-3]WIY84206.1 helix-turn-helix domain-containing protein [Propionimicrobium sp. PCR01-08-3]
MCGVADAATYLGVSTDTIRKLIADGTLPAYRLGRKKILIRVTDLECALKPIPSAVTEVVA